MKKNLWIGLCAIAALACTREMPESYSAPAAPAAGPETVVAAPVDLQEELAFQPGVAIVYVSEELASSWEEGASVDVLRRKSSEMDYLASRIGVRSATRLFPHAGEYEPRTRAEGLHRWFVVKYDERIAYREASPLLKSLPGVSSVEPSRVIRQAVTVNDPYWSQMWGMNNTAYPGYDVNCKPVWDNYTMGNPNVVVGVVDGGFQLNHPDLAANALSSGHYNYVRNNTNITQHYHGTHVAGTIGAVNNNGVGVTGIAGGNAAAGKPGVKLLSLQVFETNSDGSTSSAYDFNRALKEAADKGAVISQNSWGHNFDFNDDGQITGYELDYARNAHENPDRSFTQAIDYFNKYAGCDNNGNQLPNSPMKGGVVIFAAGNDDIPYGSPGNYDGCISVGAINRNGSRASFSNYGDWVDICAPGVSVPSTYINGQYSNLSGTSMACPHVSGVAALIASYYGGQGFTADELRQRLLAGAKDIGRSSGSKPIGPLVNAWGSFTLSGQGGQQPDPVTDLTVVTVGHNLRLDFTSTGAYAYLALACKSKTLLQNADYQNLDSNIISAVKLAANSDEAGVPQSILLAGLAPSTDYYVTVVPYSFDKKYANQAEPQKVRTADNQKPVVEIKDYPAGGYEFRHYEMVNIPVVCSDPDGDIITVSFKTNGRATLDANNGSSELYSFKLMCPVATPGSYSATVEVSDELGATTKKVIQYKVLPNEAPVQEKKFEVILLNDKGAEQQIPLNQYFTDADGEALSFRATSMDEAIAVASVNEEGILSVKAVKQGVCKVRISAEDHNGERVEQDVTVLVRMPETPEVFLYGSTVLKEGEITIIPGVEEASTTVRLISASGVVVFETSGTHSVESPISLDADNLAPGIYTLESTYTGQVFTYTIVKR